jgi:transposase
MQKRESRAGKQPRQAEPSLRGLERRLAEMQKRLDRTDAKVNSLEKKLKKVEAERDALQARCRELLADNKRKDKEIAALKIKLDSAEKQIAWFQQRMFGQSSEANLVKPESKSTGDKQKEPEAKNKKRGQRKGAKGPGRTKRNLPQEPVILDLAKPCCQACSKPFKLLPETDDSAIAEIETLLYELKYQRRRYVRQCSCEGPPIVTAPPPPRLYPRTTIGNSLWVEFCVQKFLHGIPTNRTLKDLALQGLGIAAGTVTGGMKIINDLLEPLYAAISLFCQGEKYWNADETSWRVSLDKHGNSNTKKWWQWVIAGKQAVCYILDKSRSKTVPLKFFAGSAGTLMTDRFSSYKSLPAQIRKALCWVHVRRDFAKLLVLAKFFKWAEQWLLLIAKLFVLNEQRFKLWTAEKTFGSEWQAACANLQKHVQLMQTEWQSQLQQPLHKEQRRVLLSLKRHWTGLTLFLDDPCVPLHNNKAERLLRLCVLNRKSSYGSGSEWSGHLSAKLYTIFQTWLINGLNPRALLLDYFNRCSLDPGKPPPSINDFLPWKMDQDRKTEFCLPNSYKRPA